MIIIKEITAKETHEIRVEILRKGLDLPHVFEGDDDLTTLHLGAYINKELVGIASYMKRSNDKFSDKIQFQLRGMASTEQVRGKGVGQHLIDSGLQYVKQQGATLMWCNARAIAFGFYKKNNFLHYGEKFEIPEIGIHSIMFKKLV